MRPGLIRLTSLRMTVMRLEDSIKLRRARKLHVCCLLVDQFTHQSRWWHGHRSSWSNGYSPNIRPLNEVSTMSKMPSKVFLTKNSITVTELQFYNFWQSLSVVVPLQVSYDGHSRRSREIGAIWQILTAMRVRRP
jgi:hypothetical protein